MYTHTLQICGGEDVQTIPILLAALKTLYEKQEIVILGSMG
jgi:hypothetical protein